MRTLFLLLFIFNGSFSVNRNSSEPKIKRFPCTFQLSVNQLIADDLNFQCDSAYENKAFKIENFRITFKGQPSILVSGNSLNEKSKNLAKNLKVGDFVTIFMIENIIKDDKKSNDYSTILIKIIDEPTKLTEEEKLADKENPTEKG